VARILLSAYACEPDRGSEPGVGWNWATELSRLGHQVTVLTRADNAAAIGSEPRPNLTFLYYDLPQWMQLCRKGSAGKLLYYVLWQWCAARYVRNLFTDLPFDVVQHVTYASLRYPSFMGPLGIPFYFGPVSGGEKVPAKLRTGLSVGERCRQGVRDLSNRLVPLDPWLRAVFRRAEKIIVTRDTVSMVPRRWLHKCHVRLAIGLTGDYLQQACRAPRPASGCFRLLYVGRLLECKGIDIALHAVRQLKQWQMDVRFAIVGDGPARARLTRLARRLELTEIVHWVGCIPQCRVEDYYRTADLLVFPSLRDSGGMAVLEAMAHGLPVVCTELGGPGVMVNDRCGRVLPVLDKTRGQMATLCAEAVRDIISIPGLRKALSAGATARAQDFDFQDLVRSVYPSCPIPTTVDQHEHSLQPSAAVLHDAAV
jgi:glycosyltransferase involved in cell wall biosynthesis